MTLKRPWKPLTGPLSAFLMMFGATACQTPSVASSDVLSEATTEANAKGKEAICKALEPDELDAVFFDGSPLQTRLYITKQWARWVEVCE